MKKINPIVFLKLVVPKGLLLWLVLYTPPLQAQSISPLTVNVAGGYAKAADVSLAYSVGEQSSITYYSSSSGSNLSAGFLQDFGFLDRDHLVLDLSLNNNSFEGSTTAFFIPVGDFTVKSSRMTSSSKTPLFTNLYGQGYDNPYFEIKDNVLFWSSADLAPGKETFLILARALDRKGNNVTKFFEIKRTRKAFTELSELPEQVSRELSVEVLVYPNPTSNAHITLSLKGFAVGDVFISIVTSNGVSIVEKIDKVERTTTSIPLDISRFAKGVYYVYVRQRKIVKVVKVVSN